jgi:hypothetical protein
VQESMWEALFQSYRWYESSRSCKNIVEGVKSFCITVACFVLAAEWQRNCPLNVILAFL